MRRTHTMGELPPLPTPPLGRYRHYKGGDYELVGVARHSETLGLMVVYRPLSGSAGWWVRPYEMFFEQVDVDGRLQPRFALQQAGPGPHTRSAEVGTRVRLQSFNGALRGPDDTEPAEDYWRLIGQTGVLVAAANGRGRVLVRFDAPVASFGLHCHNPVENSLFILESDLEVIV